MFFHPFDLLKFLKYCLKFLGQTLQIHQVFEVADHQSSQEVLDIQSRKTGALIRAACVLGVLAGNGSTEQLEAAAEFANNLGLAFQIRDDMLDIIGNAQQLGKAVGVDGNKNTFVHLYGIEKCDIVVQDHTEKAIKQLSKFQHTDFMTHLAEALTNRTK